MTRAGVRAKEMVIAFERSMGNEISSVSRGDGYDVLVRSEGIEKHIEAKGIEHNDSFFAINGFAGVRAFLFDEKYYIYFCDINNHKILIATGNFVLKNMGWNESEDSRRLIRAWADTGDAIKSVLGVTVDGRIRFALNRPIREIIEDLENNPDSIDSSLRETIVALWKRTDNGWVKIYP
jgi:hypothetical protein